MTRQLIDDQISIFWYSGSHFETLFSLKLSKNTEFQPLVELHHQHEAPSSGNNAQDGLSVICKRNKRESLKTLTCIFCIFHRDGISSKSSNHPKFSDCQKAANHSSNYLSNMNEFSKSNSVGYVFLTDIDQIVSNS